MKYLAVFVLFITACVANSDVKTVDTQSATDYLNQGIAFYNKGQPDQAISNFDKAIEINPKFAEAYSNWGLVFL